MYLWFVLTNSYFPWSAYKIFVADDSLPCRLLLEIPHFFKTNSSTNHAHISYIALYAYVCIVQYFHHVLQRPELQATNPNTCLSVSALTNLSNKQVTSPLEKNWHFPVTEMLKNPQGLLAFRSFFFSLTGAEFKSTIWYYIHEYCIIVT